MPRRPRLVIPGEPLHLVQRGNNRTSVFLAPDEFHVYRDLLQIASADAGCAVHAYVLMTNHVHFLATPADASGAARFMQELSQGYARWFNRRHARTGTLWEGRYRSAIIDSEPYLFACYRYIELNPVRAQMVTRPADYMWSSVRCNAWGVEDSIVTPHPRYLALGASPTAQRFAYRELLGEPEDVAEDDAAVAAFRRATHTRTVAGRKSFLAPLAEQWHRTLPPPHPGGDRRSESFRAEPRLPG